MRSLDSDQAPAAQFAGRRSVCFELQNVSLERSFCPAEQSRIDVLVDMRNEFVRLGAPPETISVHGDEVEAALELFRWARPGDLLLLSALAQRQAVLDLVGALQRDGWRPGGALPPSKLAIG